MSRGDPLTFGGEPTALPVTLARLHLRTPVGALVSLSLGPAAGADPTRAQDVAVATGWTVLAVAARPVGATLELRRERSLPSWLGPGLRLVVCGLNPSLYAADAGIGFARPGNRFWPAMLSAGLAPVDRDMEALLAAGIGMTDLVKRATVRADEVRPEEYRAGAERLARLMAWLQPVALCVLGITGWRLAVDAKATLGWQPRPLGGVPVYVMPNPSGLNAHAQVPDLIDHLRRAAHGDPR